MVTRTDYLDVVDEQGNPRRLVRSTPRTRVPSYQGVEWIDHLPSVSTADGEHCNPDGEGRWKAIHTGRVFREV